MYSGQLASEFEKATVFTKASDDQHAIGLYLVPSAFAQQVPIEGASTLRYSGPKKNADPAAITIAPTAITALKPVKRDTPTLFAASQTLPPRYQLKSATRHPPNQYTFEPVELNVL